MPQAEPTWAAVPARPQIPSPLFLLGGCHEAAEVGATIPAPPGKHGYD